MNRIVTNKLNISVYQTKSIFECKNCHRMGDDIPTTHLSFHSEISSIIEICTLVAMYTSQCRGSGGG